MTTLIPAADGQKKRVGRRRAGALTSWRRLPLREPTATFVLAVLIVGAPLLLGGVLPWTVVVIAGWSLLCIGLVAFTAPARAQAVPFLGWAMCIAAVWTAVQSAPLPCGWVASVAPQSARHARDAMTALGASTPKTCAISRDLGATLQELIKGVAIVSAFFASWLFVASGGRRSLLWLCAGSTLFMALTALTHAAFQVDQVFGLYQPVHIKREILLAPLMNANNLGGFIALGAPLWIGLTYRGADSRVRLPGVVAIAVTIVATALTASRGAIGQLIASVLLSVALVTTHGSKRQNVPGDRFGLAAALAIGLGVAVYAEGEALTREFESGDLSKFALVASAFRFARGALWLGIGRGAFSSSFVAIEGQTTRFVHAENFLAQWLAEWGLPTTVCLCFALAHALTRAWRGGAELPQRCAILAICAFGAQNLVDFGFENVGVAVVAAALLAVGVAPSSRRQTAAPPGSIRMGSLAGGVLGVGILSVLTLGPSLHRNSVAALDLVLRHEAASNDRLGFAKTLAYATWLHPSEPLFALHAAADSVRYGARGAGRRLNRAMLLAPGWEAPHALAFHWLWERGQRQQALLELRSAMEIDPHTHADQVCQLADRSPQSVLVAAPIGKNRRLYLEKIAVCLPPEHPSTGLIDDAMLRAYPDEVAALRRKAWRLYKSSNPNAALTVLDEALKIRPSYGPAQVMQAEILMAESRAQELVHGPNPARVGLTIPERRRLWNLRALASAQIAEPELAQNAVTEVRSLAGTDTKELADSYALEGNVQLRLNHIGQAFQAYREAYRISSASGHLVAVARLAESLHDRPQALWAYTHLCDIEPQGDGCRKRDELLNPSAPELPR